MPRRKPDPPAEPTSAPPREYLTPREIARMYRVRQTRVAAWIRAGTLRAINVAADGAKQPRYRVRREWLDDLDTALSVLPPRQQRRRRAKPAEIKRHFRG